ncbi:MAG TPA: EscT/YscT/HrcT family type III secretion system export apparatus protein [Leucothrix mucor]|uniref:EscT/YscT/HrcT family type III secretion system export apparatus protein n=1 Tax=Leucothrix mucor TaxID=45248 RepID=A0A7V2SZ48_LEUMU|nr:EscT/YscT/HrcT family type III secretion system export apparatus protein [Leucothrix mucor]
MDNGLFLLEEGELWLFAWALTIPRILGAIVVMPFLSSNTLPGLVRNGVVMVLSVVAIPMTMEQVKDLPLEALPLIIIVIKESILGFMMGFMFSIPFWAVSAAGYFIDMQRGTMSAEQFAAVITDQTSPLGNVLALMAVTLLFASGGFLLLYEVLLLSYQTWPIDSYFPKFNMDSVVVILHQLDLLMYTAALIAGPIVAVMYLIEVGAALVARQVPQLNVFLLTMPIKSGVGMLILIYYVTFIANFLREQFLHFGDSFQILERILK